MELEISNPSLTMEINDGGGVPEIFWATYNVTTEAELLEAYNEGKYIVVVQKNSRTTYYYQPAYISKNSAGDTLNARWIEHYPTGGGQDIYEQNFVNGTARYVKFSNHEWNLYTASFAYPDVWQPKTPEVTSGKTYVLKLVNGENKWVEEV